MCTNDFDCFYGAYGGRVCRDDMVCGRVNSVIRPAGGCAQSCGPDGGNCGPGGCGVGDCGPGGCGEGHFVDSQPYASEPYYEEIGPTGEYSPQGEYIVPGSERVVPNLEYEGGNGLRSNSSQPIPSNPMPLNSGSGVEATSFDDGYGAEGDYFEDDYLEPDGGAERSTAEYYGDDYFDTYDYSPDDPYGLTEQPVEVYEPEYGYDDDEFTTELSSPVGSGVTQADSYRENILRQAPQRRAVPASLPRRYSSVSSRMPDEEFIEKLLPMSRPPRELHPTPNY